LRLMHSAADIKQANVLSFVRALHARTEATLADLAADVRVTKPTVRTIINELRAVNVVADRNLVRGIVGRPHTMVAFTSSRGAFVGVAVDRDFVRAEWFDASLRPLGEIKVPLDRLDNDPVNVAQHIKEAPDSKVFRAHGYRLLGVGIATPTSVARAGDTPATGSKLGHSALAAALIDVLEAPLIFETPARALACAELWSRTVRLHQSFVFVNLAAEVGAGIVLGGQVVRGNSVAAGAWGHSVIAADGRMCRCGAQGCLESYVGAAGIVESLREWHPSSHLARPDDIALSLTRLGDAARAGDSDALHVVRQTGRYLGLALGSLANTLNPDAVVVGGSVASALGEPLLEATIAYTHQQGLTHVLHETEISMRSTTECSVTMGLAARVFEVQLDAVLRDAKAQRKRRRAARGGGNKGRGEISVGLSGSSALQRRG